MQRMVVLTLVALYALLVTLPGGTAVPERAYYAVLGLSASASQQDIRVAYKRLAVKLHPDKNPDKSLQDEFIKITEAYETLKDPDKRRKYDLYGSQPTYGRRYDTRSQSEYDNLYYNGLYANDLLVDNLQENSYFNYLSEGFCFINFYSPFCPPCQKISDQWKRLAENFKGLVKVAAVNCKYHNSFCYNVMRIRSYPTLLFYQNAKDRKYVTYNGHLTYEALEKFVMSYIEREERVPVDKLNLNDEPTAYIIGDSWLHKYTVARIALHLKGLAKVVQIYNEDLRRKLTKDDDTTVVLHINGMYKDIASSVESDIIDVITKSFAPVQDVNPDKLMKIRNEVRSEANAKPWVIHFSSGDKTDKHLVQKLLRKFPDIEFGDINCDKWLQLCLSLQVGDPPGWALMKVGGAYERAYVKSTVQDLSQFIENARNTENVQTLSVSEFSRIIEGDGGVWVLTVVPYKMSWDHLVEPFTTASLTFKNIQFGVMVCTASSAKYCNMMTVNNPIIVVQNSSRRHVFSGRNSGKSLTEFISNLMDNSVIELSESQFYEVLDSRSPDDTWVVAFFPEFCGQLCDSLRYEWKVVARKMRPIHYAKVGSLDCVGGNKRFCDQSNIKHPIIRVYPRASSVSYVSFMQNLGKAPYMLEWILEYVGNAAQKFTRQTFGKTVLASIDNSPLSDTSDEMPWLVYFHSPRCYHCYEMYADFFITGLMLKSYVKLGRVNCLEERDICHSEDIMSYPSIKLYTRRTFGGTRSVEFVLQPYNALVQDIKQHVATVEERLAQNLGRNTLEMATPGLKHDEF